MDDKKKRKKFHFDDDFLPDDDNETTQDPEAEESKWRPQGRKSDADGNHPNRFSNGAFLPDETYEDLLDEPDEDDFWQQKKQQYEQQMQQKKQQEKRAGRIICAMAILVLCSCGYTLFQVVRVLTAAPPQLNVPETTVSVYETVLPTDGLLPTEELLPTEAPLPTEDPEDAEYQALLARCGEIPDELQDFSQRNYYQHLSPAQQKIYPLILRSVYNQLNQVPTFTMDNNTDFNALYDVVNAVNYDYAEIFWFRGYAYCTSYSGGQVNLALEYVFPADRRQELQNVVYMETQPTIDRLQGLSDYEKIKGVHDFLTEYVTYDLSYVGTTLYELFSTGLGVCEGYARASQYMLTKLDVPVTYVVGQCIEDGVLGDYHAWNILMLDEIYYQMDVTWDDPDTDDMIFYDYFLVTDEWMSRSRIMEWDNYPICNVDYSFYAKEGNYFTSFDTAQLRRELTLDSQFDNSLVIKCADFNVYMQMYQMLNSGEFHNYLNEIGLDSSYRYWYNDVSLRITVVWEGN